VPHFGLEPTPDGSPRVYQRRGTRYPATAPDMRAANCFKSGGRCCVFRQLSLQRFRFGGEADDPAAVPAILDAEIGYEIADASLARQLRRIVRQSRWRGYRGVRVAFCATASCAADSGPSTDTSWCAAHSRNCDDPPRPRGREGVDLGAP